MDPYITKSRTRQAAAVPPPTTTTGRNSPAKTPQLTFYNCACVALRVPRSGIKLELQSRRAQEAITGATRKKLAQPETLGPEQTKSLACTLHILYSFYHFKHAITSTPATLPESCCCCCCCLSCRYRSYQSPQCSKRNMLRRRRLWQRHRCAAAGWVISMERGSIKMLECVRHANAAERESRAVCFPSGYNCRMRFLFRFIISFAPV